MKKLLIFGGTSDEHELLQALTAYPLEITLCVATEYGKIMTPTEYPGLSVHTGRLDAAQIQDFIRSEGFFCVIDATHPYATEVTKNIKAAAFESGINYLRLLRRKSDLTNTASVSTMQEAAERLNKSSGNVLLTIGSKELAAFTHVKDYQDRLYPRVLPTAESINACLTQGFKANQIIAMHGPFSRELNIALMRQFNIETVVTKDGGTLGGFPEKLEAACELKAEIIVISRPEEDGLPLDDVITLLSGLLEEA